MTEARPSFWLRPGFWRWMARLLVAGGLLLVSLVVWLLISPPSLAPVRGEIQSWLSQKLDRSVAFDELTWTWRQGLKVRVSGVEAGSGGLSVAQVRVGVAAVPLLWGEVRPQGLTLKGLRLVIERRADGRLFAGGFYVNPDRNRIFPVLARFQRFRIRDGTLIWRDQQPAEPASLALRDWDVTISREGQTHGVTLSGRVAEGRVGVEGRLDHFDQGPGGWRGMVEVTGSALPVAALTPYLGPDGPRHVAGKLAVDAALEGGLGGELSVAGHLRLDEAGVRWPQKLGAPVTGGSLRSRFHWQRGEARSSLALEDSRLAHGDAAIRGSGRLEWGAAVAEPRVEATARVAAAEVAAWRPLFAVLPGGLRDWLDRALPAGRLAGGEVVVRGPLARFPYPDGGGQFHVELDLAGLTLDYHPRWPALHDLDGTLTLDRTRLALRAEAGRLLQTPVSELRATIHDLAGDPPELRLQGAVALMLSEGVRFLEASPLQEEGFLGPAALTGPARLELGLTLPLEAEPKADVFGQLALQGARFQARPDTPALEGVSGRITFSGKTIDSEALRGRLLGQPVDLAFERQPERPFTIGLSGRFPAERLRAVLRRRGVPLSLEHYVNGEVDADLGVTWGKEQRRFRLQADLRELALAFPDPAFKAHGEPAALTVSGELNGPPAVDARLATQTGQWRLRYTPGSDPAVGVAVGWGRAAPEPQPGRVRLAGEVARLPLRQWLALAQGAVAGTTDAGSGGPPFRVDADVTLAAVRWDQHAWGGGHLDLEGRPQEAGAYRWRADFRGERLAGRLDWMRSPGQRNRLTADLARLRLPEPGQWQSVDVPGSEGGGALPALDVLLTADRIALGERELEDTRIQAQSFPERLLLHGVQTRLGKSDLRLQGDWLAERGRTRLRLDLATRDFGRWLRDVGVYPSMKGGEGSLGGTLSWPGRPRDFAMGALDGSLRLNMVEGEIEEFYFLSKALATLNVLDWPRQVLRGMRDVGSSGLVYRELRGRTRIRDGEAVLKDWVMESAPLRMTVEGGISLGRRRYDLILHLAPLQTIDQIVSAVPLVGYLLTGRERTLTALSYKVVGPWAEPEVSGLGEGDGEPGGVEGFFRRVKEMQWKDLLPWR